MRRVPLENDLDIISVYEEIAEGYIHWRARAWPIIRLVRGKRISDLGSGPCINGADMVRRGTAEYAVCLDISVSMLSAGRKMYGKNLLIDFVAGDMRNLPFRERSFDSVISIAVLHHFGPREIKTVLSEISKILCNFGLVIITTWAPWQTRFVIKIIRNYLMKILNPRIFPRKVIVPWRRKGITYPRVYYLYTLSELKSMVAHYIKPRILISGTYSKSKKARAPQNNFVIALK